ncbi:MAG: hypothetical protein EOO89_23825 [Pedobacter sp.]|nr:MAG: hypothetical protein EOO89_23825 [Pedobacter sp.]
MKPVFTCIGFLICIQLFACCNKNSAITSSPENVLNTDSMKLKITVGTTAFTATLYNNPTVAAFKTRLPMTINMSDVNANEKYFDLPGSLPANASNPGTLQTGDLMLYGSNTLVLFYKSFSTSYNYTRLARIENPSGLAAALGSGNVMVKFEAE